jgi:hypothetical protein
MFKIESADALLATFRPKDRRAVELPADLSFPVLVADYLAWQHPAGGRVFLVFAPPKGPPIGVAFDSNGGGGAGVPHLCDWCHVSSPGTGVALLTATRTSTKRIGVNVCADLSCKVKIEEQANRLGTGTRRQMEQLLERMARFAHEGLGIEPGGGNR